jgi:hypothetical protein
VDGEFENYYINMLSSVEEGKHELLTFWEHLGSKDEDLVADLVKLS